ncbi:MAG: hypothetical protein ACT4O9_03040 [Blastocatellia bacterium]
MKICPTCRKTYSDDGLNFCLEDGSILTFANSNLPETVIMQQPLPTNPNPGMVNPNIQSGWDNNPQYSIQPKKSSRKWPWVVGLLGIGLLLCGGGIVGFFVIAVYNSEQANQSSNKKNISNSVNNKGSLSSPTPSDDRTNVQRVDLSEWVKDFSAFGSTEYAGGEFVMASKQKGFYYVLVAPEDYKTESATTRVTLRNIDDAASSLGYGLIFHSNPTPLTQDYAFLIDTKKKKYRVVRHEPKKETTVVNWAASSAIKEGNQSNVLEARHKGEVIELYINDTMVTSIRNVHGYQGGVAGLYSGDAVKIAFKDLEIRR